MVPNFRFSNHGSLWMVRATSAAAHAHLTASVSLEACWLGRSLAVEPRYVAALAEALHADGFTTGIA